MLSLVLECQLAPGSPFSYSVEDFVSQSTWLILPTNCELRLPRGAIPKQSACQNTPRMVMNHDITKLITFWVVWANNQRLRLVGSHVQVFPESQKEFEASLGKSFNK